MANRFQILCIRTKKTTEGSILTHIGGKNSLGEIWSLPVQKAINGLIKEELAFFITVDGKTYTVQLFDDSEDGCELWTVGTVCNLLLTLPSCPP